MKNRIPGLKAIEAIEAYLRKFSAPIGWQPRLDAPATSLKCKTGTCALIDTGEIQALVTCEHVWTAWVSYKQKHASAELLIGLDDGVPLNLRDGKLVDCDKDLDLAVVRAEVRPQRMLTKAFYRIEEWPIPQPKVGDVVAIIGFPGVRRVPVGRHTTRWTGEFLAYGVSGVSERDITLAPERNDRRSYDENWNELPHGNIGGMSGSPAFLVSEQVPPPLVGFLRAGNTSDNFIFLTPARYLQRDGTLRG